MSETGVKIDMDSAAMFLMQAYTAYKAACDSGVLSSLGDDIIATVDKFSDARLAREVKAYKAYIEAGMPPEGAVQMLLARRRVFHNDFTEFLNSIGRNLRAEMQFKMPTKE